MQRSSQTYKYCTHKWKIHIKKKFLAVEFLLVNVSQHMELLSVNISMIFWFLKKKSFFFLKVFYIHLIHEACKVVYFCKTMQRPI